MNSKSFFIVLLAIFALAAARPKKASSPEADPEAETKVREKRKYEIPLVRQLEEGGVGVKREAAPPEAASPSKGKEAEEGGAEQAEDGGLRVKKQSPNNVCIKVGGCGKTVCGPMVSARGAVIGDVRAMLQGGNPMLPMGDLHPAPVNEMSDAASKLEGFGPVQGRTVDAIVAPVALGTLGYGTPASYSAAPAAFDLGQSFFKPQAASAVPAVAVIAAPHQPSHPLVHPWLVPHLLPHLLPHVLPHVLPHAVPSLSSGVGSYFGPHRLEPVRFPDGLQTEGKQPALSYPQPFYGGADNALLCQPLRTQRVDAPYDFLYRPDVAGDKSINVTDGSKRSQSEGDEERRMRDHLRKVNEIKDEISELNRAAQRIVDQQERLTALQHKQMLGAPGQGTAPYMGSGYYAHPAMPWGYSRSNILSYPRSQDDIDFFVNLLKAGKSMAQLSDPVQPSVLSTIANVFKGVQDGGKGQKDAVDGVDRSDDGKDGKQDKKSRR